MDEKQLMTGPAKPSVACVYDYLLGGADNFPAARAAADEVVRIQPLAACWGGRTGTS